RDKKMRFEHAQARAEGIVKTISTRFDPEHDPDNREIKKEDEMWHARIRKRDRDDGRAARHRPVRGCVEPRAPDHDATQFSAVKMRHRIDVARIVKARL